MASISSILEFVSGACSGTAHAADIVGEQSVALGMGRYVGILDIDKDSGMGSVQETLRGHSERVNCVRASADHSLFVSGAADGTARIWERSEETGGEPGKPGAWRCTGVLGAAGAASVVAVAAAVVQPGQAVVVTSSTDGVVRVWQHVRDQGAAGDQIEPVQELAAGKRGSALAVALAEVAGGQLLLATGGTDGVVRVYSGQQQQHGSGAVSFGAPVCLAGHEDWVTDVDFRLVARDGDGQEEEEARGATAHWRAGDVALASASQDRHVRVWLVSRAADQASAQDLLDACTQALARNQPLSTAAQVLAGPPPRRSVALDAVLAAHDGWVHSARWRADGGGTGGGHGLVTASADGSAMLWEAADAWQPVARLGGGQALLGCVARGPWLLAHGLHGTLHLWRQPGQPGQPGQQPGQGAWEPRAASSGHAAGVRDVCWHASGLAVLSVAADQTARVFARTQHSGWREVARPQVHGYDMRAAAFVGPTAYVSAGEEKVARVFGATRQFGSAWAALVGQQLEGCERLVAGASQPVLGLSN
ncbi:Elongator subunit elp2, partial [Coemansia erecta]